MTVGELIKDLSEYPEDMPVQITYLNFRDNSEVDFDLDGIGTRGDVNENGRYKPEKVIIHLGKDPERLRKEMEDCFRLADGAMEDMKEIMKDI